MFDNKRWTKRLCDSRINERWTILMHRDLESKAGVKFEWLISQGHNNEVKLSDQQMKEFIDLVERWESSKYEESRYEEAKY